MADDYLFNFETDDDLRTYVGMLDTELAAAAAKELQRRAREREEHGIPDPVTRKEKNDG